MIALDLLDTAMNVIINILLMCKKSENKILQNMKANLHIIVCTVQ